MELRRIQMRLTEQQLASYVAKGYLHIKEFFNSYDIEQCSVEIQRLGGLSDFIDEGNIRTGFRKLDDSGRMILERFDPVIDISPVYRKIAENAKIGELLQQIYGEEMLLFKDKLIMKFPGTIGYPMHQDASWLQGFPYKSITTVMIAIDSATNDSGALQVFPGYHHQLITEEGNFRNLTEDEISNIDMNLGETIETSPGDIIIFHSLVPHCSGPNHSEKRRAQFYLTYCSANYGDLREKYYKFELERANYKFVRILKRQGKRPFLK